MNSAERLHRRRCIGLRIAVIFAIMLVPVSWPDWAAMAVVAGSGLFALAVLLKDCRRPVPDPAQSGTHTRDGER